VSYNLACGYTAGEGHRLNMDPRTSEVNLGSMVRAWLSRSLQQVLQLGALARNAGDWLRLVADY